MPAAATKPRVGPRLASGRDRALSSRNLSGALRIAHRLRKSLMEVVKAAQTLAVIEGRPWDPPPALVDKARKLTQSVCELSEEIRIADLAAQKELAGADIDELERALLAKLIATTTPEQLRAMAEEKERAEREGDRGLS